MSKKGRYIRINKKLYLVLKNIKALCEILLHQLQQYNTGNRALKGELKHNNRFRYNKLET